MAATAHAAPIVLWAPQPGPQTALVTCPVFEVFYGGARGGGKTDGMLGEWAMHADKYGKHANGVFFRRELVQLDEAIARSQELYVHLGAKWNDQKKTWLFPTGARLKFRYLARDADAEAYQGHSYTRVYFEELTNFPDPRPVMKLKATLRSAAGVPCRMRATGNPGGPGHNWVKTRYIDPDIRGYKPITDEDGLERVFIPSRLTDNPALVKNDPTYIARLKQSGSTQLVKAWLEGDWSIVEGAFFDCWGSQHVIRPFAIPEHWLRFRSGDWGSARPFSFGWWAVASDDYEHPDGFVIPRNAIVRYREWYGVHEKPDGTVEPNVGLKLHAEVVGEALYRKEKDDPKITYGVLDPSAFSEDGGPSIAERIYNGSGKRIAFRRADNARVSQKGAMGGWDQMRGRMIGEDGRPMIYCFSTCVDSIRTIPVLQHDTDKPEDMDSDGEDHAADDWRYACMSRPYTRPTPTKTEPIKGMESLTLEHLFKHHDKTRQKRI